MTQEQKSELIQLLNLAHYNAAIQNQGNISTVTALAAHQGSGSVIQSIAAGILSMGGQHAPLEAARSIIKRYKDGDKGKFKSMIYYLMDNGQKIPGFGNSFYKDRIDPSFEPVYNKYVDIVGIDDNPIRPISSIVNSYFKKKGKETFLLPNAAIITAAIVEDAGFTAGQEVAIALQGRISAWVHMMNG